jgi:hypothetical protein
MGRCPWLERAKKALPFCVLEPGRRTITRYFLTRGNGMARKVLRLTPPPASEPDSTEQKRPAPERKPLPSREEVNAWISELEAQLASDDAKGNVGLPSLVVAGGATAGVDYHRGAAGNGTSDCDGIHRDFERGWHHERRCWNCC